MSLFHNSVIIDSAFASLDWRHAFLKIIHFIIKMPAFDLTGNSFEIIFEIPIFNCEFQQSVFM